MATAKRRLPEIALCGTVLCCCVLFIHSAAGYVSADGGSLLKYAVSAVWRLCAVAVPGFVFLAGARFMLSARDKGDSFPVGKYYLSRVRRVLLPYIAWCAVYYAYILLTGAERFSVTRFLRGILLGDFTGHLYFIPVIIQLYLLAPLSLLLRRKAKVPSAVIMTLAVLITVCFGPFLPDVLAAVFPRAPYFQYSDRVFTSYLMYWAAGCCAGAVWEEFSATLVRLRYGVYGLFAFSAVCNLAAVYYSYVAKRFVWCIEELAMLYNFAAVAFFLAVALRLTAKKKTASAWLCAADAAVFPVYFSHILVLSLCGTAFSRLGAGGFAAFILKFTVLLLWAALLTVLYRLWQKRGGPGTKTGNGKKVT